MEAAYEGLQGHHQDPVPHRQGPRPQGAAKLSQSIKAFRDGGLAQADIAAVRAGVKQSPKGPGAPPTGADAGDAGVMGRAAARAAVRPLPAAPARSLIEARAQRSALDRALSTLPSQRGEMPVGKKCGGLAVMPRKK